MKTTIEFTARFDLPDGVALDISDIKREEERLGRMLCAAISSYAKDGNISYQLTHTEGGDVLT